MRVTAVIPTLNEERTIDRPADIPRLLAPILGGEADLVIASRATGGSDKLDGQLGHLPRALGMKVAQTCVNLRFGVRLTGIQNGFRALPAQVARELLLRHPGFAIDQEMAIRCLRLGYRVANVPSHEDRRRHGKPGLRFWRVAPAVLWNAVTLLAGSPIEAPRRRTP